MYFTSKQANLSKQVLDKKRLLLAYYYITLH
jgi:hypothetical protein